MVVRDVGKRMAALAAILEWVRSENITCRRVRLATTRSDKRSGTIRVHHVVFCLCNIPLSRRVLIGRRALFVDRHLNQTLAFQSNCLFKALISDRSNIAMWEIYACYERTIKSTTQQNIICTIGLKIPFPRNHYSNKATVNNRKRHKL